MNWYHKIILAKSFTYKLPNDPKQKLYDFYMFSVLPKTQDIYLQDGLDQIEDEVVGQLKDHLLKGVFFALIAEARHVFFQNDVENLSENIRHGTLRESIPLLESYRKIYHPNDPDTPGSDPTVETPLTRFKKDKSEYRLSNRAMRMALRETGSDMIDAVKLVRYFFYEASWDTSYGGKVWGAIADAWLSLYDAQGTNAIVIYIDHIYDLQHNTDTIFNKLHSYGTEKSNTSIKDYSWVKDALDHKAKITSPYELLPYVSPQMKAIATRVLHKHGDFDQPMSSDQYFVDNLDDIKDKWINVVRAKHEYLKKIPDMVKKLLSENDILSLIEIVIMGDNTYKDKQSRYWQWASYVPADMKQVYWKNNTEEQIKTTFIPSFTHAPGRFSTLEMIELCGQYNPALLYSDIEKKNVWMDYFAKLKRPFATTRDFINMPEELKKLIDENEMNVVVEYHIRDLWKNTEQTQIDYASLTQWSYYAYEIKSIIKTKHHYTLENFGATIMRQDLIYGTTYFSHLTDDDFKEAIGIEVMAEAALNNLKREQKNKLLNNTLVLTRNELWFRVPDNLSLLLAMGKIDPVFIQKSISSDVWPTDYYACPNSISLLRQEFTDFESSPDVSKTDVSKTPRSPVRLKPNETLIDGVYGPPPQHQNIDDIKPKQIERSWDNFWERHNPHSIT